MNRVVVMKSQLKMTESENRAAWDRWAKRDVLWHIAHEKDEASFASSGQAIIERRFARFIRPLERGSRLLDIGCGIGRLMQAAHLINPEVQCFGVDVSGEMVKQANERHRSNDKLVFLRGSGRGLDMFSDAYFDLVFSYVVFQHLPTAVFRGYLEEVGRVLKKGGIFGFQVQYDANKLQTKHELPDTDFRTIRYYSDDEIREMVPATMRVNKVSPCAGLDFVHDVMAYCTKR